MFLPDNPLWTFALTVYEPTRPLLLEWQNTRDAHVNDILWLAYARCRGVGVDWRLWHRVEQGRPRALLRRVRALRLCAQQGEPGRSRLLEWELAFEGIDITMLAECLDTGHRLAERDIKRLAHHWRAPPPDLTALIERLVRVFTHRSRHGNL